MQILKSLWSIATMKIGFIVGFCILGLPTVGWRLIALTVALSGMGLGLVWPPFQFQRLFGPEALQSNEGEALRISAAVALSIGVLIGLAIGVFLTAMLISIAPVHTRAVVSTWTR